MNLIIFKAFAFASLLFNSAAAGHVDATVLVVGGSPAGIKAAADLSAAGIEYLLIEDCAQLRGHLESLDFGGHTFSPGALFGYTPIKEKLEELGVSYTEPDWYSCSVYDQDGENITDAFKARDLEWFAASANAYSEIIDDIDNNVKPDISVKAAAARGGFRASNDMDRLVEWWWVEIHGGVSARDSSTINTYRQAALFPDTYVILDDRTLAYPLLGDLEEQIDESNIIWNERVRVVNQTAGDTVTVTTENGTSFSSEYVIVTNTVGALQNGFVTFDPPLPGWKYEEFCRWQMGTLEPIFMKFPSKFWDDVEWILQASEYRGYYPAFLNMEAEGYLEDGSNILIGFVAGDEAYRVERLSDREVQAEIMEVLRTIYGEDIPDPDEFYVSRFFTDVDHFGLYAHWPIGTLPEDGQTRLRAHIGRVYFTPEDAADEYVGIPFGSINDGAASAASVIKCITDGECDEYTPVDSTLPQCSEAKSPGKYRKNQ